MCPNELVRVNAQVMTRDESSGCWIPLGGGGLASVAIIRREISPKVHQINNTDGTTSPITTSPMHSTSNAAASGLQSHESSNVSPPSTNKRKYEYFICGEHNTDESVFLRCAIKKDFEYNLIMPTFLHWRSEGQVFGLTFVSTSDGAQFDGGVRAAIGELWEGVSDLTLTTNVQDTGDDDVFMTLDLPVEPPEPRSSLGTPHGIRVPNYSQPSELPDSYRSIHYIGGSSIKVTPPHPLASAADIELDNYPYVQLTTLNHEYLYPNIDEHKGERLDGHNTSNSGSSLKKPDTIISQPSKNTVKRNVRLRCKHCHELYSEQHNPKGSCEYAPDPIRRGIATISCLSCAQCMLYHCMSDAEGDFAQNPCSCSTEEGCGRRWFGLTVLSMFVPCLWIYPPLKAVHWCGISCGMCGGRHHPME
ncbi:PREDICTED: sprouty-related, EVH1 domain-containing protein 1 isoform X2 [Vollenhovia emeryi]|uniref:sprouty-related, EVH1 domain-containing protein 1 isoform X2 n=1 Tax=Vollenhovia emeryi TaxID=411798 RepID=UPI0005F57374|nr:PREDICTED: sprouty-related, EVH1 domain-containing protein 1 isoform X2 [Vollenhovia emeryi]